MDSIEELGLDTLIELAALPDSMWRVLCSSVNYRLQHPEWESEIITHYLGAWEYDRPTWDALRKEITEARARADEQRLDGAKLTRKEYMRAYMRRRRIAKL